MKVLILSAGTGSRLGLNLPKSLTQIDDRKVIDIQLGVLGQLGIAEKDITVVTGYKDYLFQQYKFKKILNEDFKSTGQVYSMSRASSLKSEKQVLVIYGDILFEKTLLEKLTETDFSFLVPSFINFKNLWMQRGDSMFQDLETYKVNENNEIMEIGNQVIDISLVNGQFMGMLYFNNYYFKNFLNWYEEFGKLINLNKYKKIQTTHFLNYLIKKGIKIKSIDYDGYFMELDSKSDLEFIKNSINF